MRNPLSGTKYANVAATLALVTALGGTSYAAATIGTNDIQRNAVTAPKIKNGAVKTNKIRPNAVSSTRVKDHSLTGADVKDNSLTGNDVQDVVLHTLDLKNNWTAYDAASTPRYAKDASGIVHLSGAVKLEAAYNGTFAELPADVRPSRDVYVSTHLNGGAGPARIIITKAGLVQVHFTAPAMEPSAKAFTSLEGVSFIP